MNSTETETDRERRTDRETERQRDRQRRLERQRDRKVFNDKKTDIETVFKQYPIVLVGYDHIQHYGFMVESSKNPPLQHLCVPFFHLNQIRHAHLCCPKLLLVDWTKKKCKIERMSEHYFVEQFIIFNDDPLMITRLLVSNKGTKWIEEKELKKTCTLGVEGDGPTL